MIVGQSDELCYDATSSEPALHRVQEYILAPLHEYKLMFRPSYVHIALRVVHNRKILLGKHPGTVAYLGF